MRWFLDGQGSSPTIPQRLTMGKNGPHMPGRKYAFRCYSSPSMDVTISPEISGRRNVRQTADFVRHCQSCLGVMFERSIYLVP